MSGPPSEFRRDPYSGEWVTIAGSRQARPALPDSCPFCVGGIEAPEAYSVKSFTNRWPVMRPMSRVLADDEECRGHSADEILDELRTRPAAALAGANGGTAFHESAPAVGDAEVLLYTPEHEGSLGALPADQLCKVWDLWCERTEVLSGRNEIASVLIFENRGEEVGVTIHHPHGQIYAFPFLPPRQRNEFDLARKRKAAGQSCAVCEVSTTDAVGPLALISNEDVIAHVPYAGAWPYEAHIVPRRHVGSITDLSGSESKSMRDLLGRVLRGGDRIFDRPLPTMMALLQRPCDNSDPTDLWHFRIEIVSPLRKATTLRYVAAAEVSSGTFANPVTPEDAAEKWRGAIEAEA